MNDIVQNGRGAADKGKTVVARAVASKRLRGRPALDGEAQRQKILAVAGRMFIAKGFSGATLDAIGKAAGITKRTIYQHIGNKEELFRVTCKERLPQADTLRFDLPLEGGDLRAIVTAMARELLRYSFTSEAIALERILAIESLRFPRLVGQVVEDGMQIMNGNIAEIFVEMIRLGLIPPLDPPRAADLFYDAITGNRGFRMTMGHTELPPDEEELAQRVDMFIHGHLLRGPGPAAGG